MNPFNDLARGLVGDGPPSRPCEWCGETPATSESACLADDSGEGPLFVCDTCAELDRALQARRMESVKTMFPGSHVHFGQTGWTCPECGWTSPAVRRTDSSGETLVVGDTVTVEGDPVPRYTVTALTDDGVRVLSDDGEETTVAYDRVTYHRGY